MLLGLTSMERVFHIYNTVVSIKQPLLSNHNGRCDKMQFGLTL